MTHYPKICLWFDREAEQAAQLYTSVLRNGRIGAVTRYMDPDPTPANRPGEVMTVEFEAEGLSFIALNGGPQFTFNEAVSIQLYRDTQAELDATWEALIADGGQPSACGWLKDRFGMVWQVCPHRLVELTTSADSAQARRVMDAMLTMQKIDLAAMEAAAAG